jgi:ankyrin repeat protein
MTKKLIILVASLFLAQSCKAMEQESAFLTELRERFSRPQDVNSKDGYAEGQPYLHEAIDRGDIGAVTFLIDQQHARLDVANTTGDCPLHIAINRRYRDIAGFLLQKDRSIIELPGAEGAYPLHVATTVQDQDVVRLLLENRALLTVTNDMGRTPLHTAVARRSQVLARLLAGPDVINTHDRTGDTPLHIAVRNRLAQIVTELLAHNADVKAQAAGGNTSLHLAVTGENVSQDLLRLLLEREDAVNAQNPGRNIVLGVNIANQAGDTPLHIAVRNRLAQIVTELLAHNADVKAQAAGGNTSLHLAVTGENVSQDLLRLLLVREDAVNAQNPGRNIVLGVNIANQAGDTPLHIAVRNRLIQIVTELLAHNADVKAQAAGGNTPLHLAVTGGNVSLDLLRLLLEREDAVAGVNARNAGGNTPLHLAVQDAAIAFESIKFLIDHGALARCRNNRHQFVRDLVAPGCDDRIKYEVDVAFQIFLIKCWDNIIYGRDACINFISSNSQRIAYMVSVLLGKLARARRTRVNREDVMDSIAKGFGDKPEDRQIATTLAEYLFPAGQEVPVAAIEAQAEQHPQQEAPVAEPGLPVIPARGNSFCPIL